MSVLYITVGNQLTTLIEGPDSSLDLDENGKVTAIVNYKTKRQMALIVALRSARHPDYPMLVRKTINIQFEPPDWANVSVKFEGAVTSSAETEPGVKKTYSISGTTGNEPIETHEQFPTFGGKPPTGKKGTNDKGATFDDAGKFTGFAVQDIDNDLDYYGTDPNLNLAGVRSYLAPGVIYTETATYNGAGRADAPSNLDNLGKIDTPP